MSGIDTPPLEPLRDLLARLDRAGLHGVLGGSGLLAAHGLVDRVNDWDVTVDCEVGALRAACDGLEYGFFGHNGCHADHKLTFERERVELIPRLAYFVPDGVVHIPGNETRRWQGLPVGSPSGWAVAYALLGAAESSARRLERAEALFDWMRRHGADPAGHAALLREPLPHALRERLLALPVSPAG